MLWWVAQNVIIVAILAAVVSLICRGKRLSPAARHALWLVVLIKLVTPPLFVWPWGISIPAETFIEAGDVKIVNVKQDLNQTEAIVLEEMETAPSATAEVGDEAFLDADGLIVSSETFVVPLNTRNNQVTPVASASVLPEIQSRMQVEQRSVWNFDRGIFWGSIIWTTGILVMALWQGLRIWKMNRLVNTAQPAPEWLSRLLEETSILLSIRAPQIFLVRGISTPLLWAWGKPMLLWPQELSEQLSPEAKQGVLLHELAHLKRKDHWVGRLELVAGCLWWPNPLFWYVRHQLRENAELACDAWVVQTLPNGRRDYADALLTVCQNYSHPAVPLPALGMGKSTRRTLERRLTMILRDRVPFRVSWWGMIAVLLLGVLILPSWSQTKEGQSKKETTQFQDSESKNDVTDELAEPAEVVEVGGEVQLEPDVGRTVIINDQEELLGIFEDTPNTARVRDRRLQEIEKKLQSLLGELRELRGKKVVIKTDSTRKSSDSEVPRKKNNKKKSGIPPIVLEQLRLAADQLKVESFNALSGIIKLNQRRLNPVEEELAKIEKELELKQHELEVKRIATAAIIFAESRKQAEAKQAEVVETKTITLVRTTYRITRVDAKSLEDLIRKIVKADFLQIQIADYVRTITDPEPYGDPNIKLNLALKGYEKPSKTKGTIHFWSHAFTVTTTSETQEYIGRLIALIEKAPRKEVPKQSKPSSPGRRGRSQSEIFLEPVDQQFQEERPFRGLYSGQSNRRRSNTKRED